ncbi:lipase 3-like [Colias croceus]|uniref:lipase 3-like n=1 Tax=Colias crocea TaxID=72248 RepID=UPI001E27B1EB|nr:lipase 3-like [Colias croceus]
MWIRLVLIVGSLTLSAAGPSPNAEYVEKLIRTNAFDERLIDSDLLIDALLDVPAIIRRHNYPLEEHSVVTPDGYILGMHRIPYGRDRHNLPGDRPAILVMHGLLSSSADYIITGPGNALGYLLAEEGYDVWLGNARGNYYSRKHMYLNPNALFNSTFWEFSWDEIGNIDLPAMIDYILAETGKSKLHYAGMSQGTTSFFVMGALRPDYNDKIISMHALAPVAYMEHSKNPLFHVLAPYATDIASLASLIGIGEILPNSFLWTLVGQSVCKDESKLQFACKHAIFFIGGRSEDQLNSTLLPAKLGHIPAGCALKQLAHYGQSIISGKFRRYDHGWVRNLQQYGRIEPPNYDLSRINAPVFLHYSESDPLADVIDVDRLYKELGGPVARIRVPLKTFSHIDFVWGINAKELVYDEMINIMKMFDKN